MTRAPCRRRTGEAVPRAEKFGDLITADHKVLNEGREPTPRREQTVRSEDLSGELQGEPGEPQPTESKDDAEARADWSIQGDFIYRHHNEPRVQLCVPKVTRSTHTDLDVMQEKCIDDSWNVYSNRSLPDSWKGVTRITPVKEKPSEGMYVVRRETDKSSNNYAAQNREKQEWKNEKPQLENARRLRGIYIIDPDDEENKETLKHARKKLEWSMDAAILCKKVIHSGFRKLGAELNASHEVPKTKIMVVSRIHMATSGTCST